MVSKIIIDRIKYKKAIDFAYNSYKTEFRKGIKIPYFIYLSSVSNLIIENNGTTDEAVAGLLHDICEIPNGKKKLNQIKIKFGSKVHNIVKQCSSDLSDSIIPVNDWKEKKVLFLESMQKKSQSTLLVCLCDKLHSITCIINDYNKIGKKIWPNYGTSPENAIWYYKSLCKNFKKYLKNHKGLKDKLQRNVNELTYFVKK